MPTPSLELFFNPRSIAIIGLSREALSGPVSVLNTLRGYGYQGSVSIINPNISEPVDEVVYPGVGDMPEPADLAIIVVGRSLVPGTLRDCAQSGIRAAIIITQGFADADQEGARLQLEIIEICRTYDIRVLGPNTIGLSNAFADFTSSFIQVHNSKIPVGIISQSGLFMMGHHIINNQPAGFGVAVDLGNACDVSLVEILEYYENDDNIRVIHCHVEGIRDGPGFLNAASRISREKPIIMFKSGVSDTGRNAVASHSGAVAGENEVYQAAFSRAGLISASSAEELWVLTKAFATYSPPKGKRVAIMSFSGGAAIMAIDALENAGLELAQLSQTTIDAVRPLYPPWMEVDNPLDIWMAVARNFHQTYPQILELLMQDDGVDSVICIYPSFSLPKYAAYDCSGHIRTLAKAYPEKPVLCWSYGIDVEGFTESIETDGNCMVFPSLNDVANTLVKLGQYGDSRLKPVDEPGVIDAKIGTVKDILGKAKTAGRDYLFTEGFQMLQAYGVETAKWQFLTDGLWDLSDDIEFPVCMKVVSGEILHKSDVGGVVLNIMDQHELVNGYESFSALDAKIDGVLIQEMAPKGKEVMIGVKKDPVFGHCLIFGAGGVYAETLNDFSFRLAPISRRDAYQMIDEIAFAKILKGVRGEEPCNLHAIVDILERVSQMVCDNPDIQELDINPVIVNEQGALIVDVRILI
ncbi:MAG: acetate--CoA ligase family protein [Rhodospirillaceae bacterium]|jgi:acetate---CoA ligase (ADP-forming)|nr:acetate--CoA ligase family protein [Rhodospirillaceae bacterium]MBT5244451.1 acetate--CoA ligase family protein [Rhodospirillaceae bacterium]MBT5561393.1 acetate--CoA ligase family protein [Rhodospirillaceae bacterium]MBT6242033.1 acetate--CoA ligase family protein [Rhodospirillaceae bacterium]MBT7136734.1 acetate--CoA ligase family protein [Rhodospirillaceae bacterium]